MTDSFSFLSYRFLTASFCIAGSLLLTSCSTKLQVQSEPPGAQVLWSPTGVEDWREWPPNSWNPGRDPSGQSYTTPLSDSATYSNTIWITVEKDGYYRPLPQVVELMASRKEEVFFELVETSDAKAQRMLAEGYVLWKGEWVLPGENNLEEYKGTWMLTEEAFDRRQRDNGLLQYEGQWLAPDVAASRYSADQQSKGFELFKDRWVKPEVREMEESIDGEVAAYQNKDSVDELRLPRVVGSVDVELAQLQIHNSSRFQLRLLLSGPRSQSIILDPYETFGSGNSEALEERLTLIPGRYGIVVEPRFSEQELQQQSLNGRRDPISNRQDLPLPAMTEHPFSAGFQYLLTFNPDGNSLEEGLGEYTRRESQIPDDLPTIKVPDVQLPEQQPGRRNSGGGGGRRGPR